MSDIGKLLYLWYPKMMLENQALFPLSANGLWNRKIIFPHQKMPRFFISGDRKPLSNIRKCYYRKYFSDIRRRLWISDIRKWFFHIGKLEHFQILGMQQHFLIPENNFRNQKFEFLIQKIISQYGKIRVFSEVGKLFLIWDFLIWQITFWHLKILNKYTFDTPYEVTHQSYSYV